jgi:polyisoprenoid-binding protein YceI
MSTWLSGGVLLLTAQALSAQVIPREVQVDAAASHIYVVTRRTGLLKFLGHEHVIQAEQWSARLCWAAPSPADSRAEFSVDARSLTIDGDSARVRAGLGKGPSPRQRAQIQRKLLDVEHLDVNQHPELRFESTSVEGDSSELIVRGRLTVKGVTRAVALPVRVSIDPYDIILLHGTLTVLQSAFDIRPESIAGVVKVADPVEINIRMRGTLSNQACSVL